MNQETQNETLPRQDCLLPFEPPTYLATPHYTTPFVDIALAILFFCT
jgi:hypothetical protein